MQSINQVIFALNLMTFTIQLFVVKNKLFSLVLGAKDTFVIII